MVEEDFAETVLDPLHAVVKPGHALGHAAADRVIDLVQGGEVRAAELLQPEGVTI